MKRIIDSLVEIEDTLEMREAPALLEPSLFQTTNKISLPLQVNPLVEGNLKNALWYVLEGFEVYGEVNLGKGYGRIDLLCDKSSVRAGSGVMVGSGIRVGVECKNNFMNIRKKDLNYAKSPVINALYFASFAVWDYEFSLDYLEAKIEGRKTVLQLLRWIHFGKRSIEMRGGSFEDVIHTHKVSSDKYQKEMENSLKSLRVKYREGIDIPPYGVVLYNPLGEMWVASGAQVLKDYTSPPAEEKIKPAKEAFINFSVWKHFKDLEHIVAAECGLPGATTIETKYVNRKVNYGTINLPTEVRQRFHKGHNTIDITAMPKSSVNETNLSKLKIMGVECKASINKDKLSKQLESYLKSGDLSELYLAIPQVLESRAEKLLTQQRLDTKEDLTSVGILSVNDNGEIEEIKEAKELELKKPYFFEIEKRKVEDVRFKERLYCEFLNQVF